jgi:uncharacterized Tic20 family protein
MSVADELQKLQQLHQAGALSDDEFASAKAKLLGSPAEPLQVSAVPPEGAGSSSWSQDQQTRQWAFFLHLSILAGYALPLAGLVAPVVIWQWKKAELPGLDVHGKNAVNWILSVILYAVVCVILALAVVGIPLLIALGVVGVVFPIVAAIKANNGEVWKYPLAITFLR